MIKVLKNWNQIGEATHFLDRKSLPKHFTPEKNWDLSELSKIAYPLPRNAKIIDLGFGDLYAIKLLKTIGFTALWGIDLALTLKHRANQVKHMIQNGSFRPPYKLYRRSICETGFKDNYFAMATCISVLEHGVNLDYFLDESYRILTPKGLLFLTMDYWKEIIPVPQELTAFHQPWKIFSKNDIEQLLLSAFKTGFSLYKEMKIPECEDRCVIWNQKEYTFINIILQKQTSK